MQHRNCGQSVAPQGGGITGTNAQNNQRKKKTTIKQVKAVLDLDQRIYKEK